MQSSLVDVLSPYRAVQIAQSSVRAGSDWEKAASTMSFSYISTAVGGRLCSKGLWHTQVQRAHAVRYRALRACNVHRSKEKFP